jgi:hypothetical protein
VKNLLSPFYILGFRYIRIENYPGELKPENFTAVALYSDMKPTGSFSSSNALINQLQHNIQWGQREIFWMCQLIAHNVMNVWAGQRCSGFLKNGRL